VNRLRRKSKQRAARDRGSAPFVAKLKREIAHCEYCNHWFEGGSPRRYEQHEIAGGPLREKARTKRFAVLGLCKVCHRMIHNDLGWPRARQLALLKHNRLRDYDLEAFNELVGYGPNRITEEEVEAYE